MLYMISTITLCGRFYQKQFLRCRNWSICSTGFVWTHEHIWTDLNKILTWLSYGWRLEEHTFDLLWNVWSKTRIWVKIGGGLRALCVFLSFQVCRRKWKYFKGFAYIGLTNLAIWSINPDILKMFHFWPPKMMCFSF